MQELLQLSGTVENITFAKQETGFTVLELNTGDELVTVVGIMPHTVPGEALRVTGRWDVHATFGQQFRADNFERYAPETAGGILTYLSSGIIKGIGKATAMQIIERFGEQSLAVIEREPERLADIKGISKAKAAKISEEFKKQMGIREIMLRLGEYSIKPEEALKIFRLFGVQALVLMEENPYIICAEDIGVEFQRADEIASKLPGKIDPKHRSAAGIMYILRHNLQNGHTCIPREKLVTASAEWLEISADQAEIMIDDLAGQNQIITDSVQDRDFVFLPLLYKSEKYAAQRLRVMLEHPAVPIRAPEAQINAIERVNGITYESIQKQAIITALSSGMLILTGGPGTGKTTTLNAIISILELHELKVLLAAPTGRAAKRMSELCSREAKTIHRLLEVEWVDGDKSVFGRNERNMLDCDAIIIDEISMVDALLFEALLRALPMGCRLILVGDSDQLPSVGAGNVLGDLVDSGLVPTVRLKKIFRQAMASQIVINAHKIVAGEFPDLAVRDNDFFFMPFQTESQAASTTADLLCRRLPASYGYDPLRDIQILCPSKKRETGTHSLNQLLQGRLNPPAPGRREINRMGYILREGDKIMQIKNNYDVTWTADDGQTGSGVFNGDIGTLLSIDPAVGLLSVKFDDRLALYTKEDAESLELAYAVTVHKSQGNEFDCVILPIINVIPQLSYRNLLYTAVTRAKKLLIITGTSRAVNAMVANNRKTLRYTALKAFLLE